MEALLRGHHDRVHALCRRLTGNADDADDATQEALVAIVRGLPGYDGRSAFSTWAYRVTTNVCMDELRRRGRRPPPARDEDPPEVAAPVDVGRAVATRLDVDAALGRLPLEFRTAVVLRDLCDLGYDEIAEVLQIPPGTVRSRISRGRAALAPLLAGNPEEPGERRRG